MWTPSATDLLWAFAGFLAGFNLAGWIGLALLDRGRSGMPWRAP